MNAYISKFVPFDYKTIKYKLEKEEESRNGCRAWELDLPSVAVASMEKRYNSLMLIKIRQFLYTHQLNAISKG
ncbi:hypothetical protein Csa_007734 [Cucumis sativus]|uniref:Uncharacterized protein n=1 Tax=Cucumis sativus TaxID=3659 RepID=A0A0A0KTY6_CUCSA|nr:hypothetical protein Csa_007734 [Cucumis sativus]